MQGFLRAVADTHLSGMVCESLILLRCWGRVGGSLLGVSEDLLLLQLGVTLAQHLLSSSLCAK